MKPYEAYNNIELPWLKSIPAHWNLVGLNLLFSDNKVKNEGVTEKNILSLSYGNIVQRKKEENFGLIPASYETYQVVNSGYIILRLTDMQNDHKSLRVGLAKEKGIITSAYTGLVPKQNVNSTYFYYLLHTLDLVKYIYVLGGGVRQSSDYNEIKKFKLPLPPLEEQAAIANYLDAQKEKINLFIAKKQKLIALLKEQRQSIINDAVVKGINTNAKMKTSSFDWLGEIPQNWEEKRLRFLGRCQNGMNKDQEFFGSGYPFVNYSDVYKNETLPSNPSGLALSNEIDRKTYSVLEGDVFFTRTSETANEIGFASVCLKTIPNATFSGFLIRFRPNRNSQLHPSFSKYYFRCELHRIFFAKEINLVTRASLSQNLVKNLPVLIPPLQEQLEIVQHIKTETKRIDEVIVRTEKEIELIKEYRDSIVAEVVTGKLDIRTAKLKQYKIQDTPLALAAEDKN